MHCLQGSAWEGGEQTEWRKKGREGGGNGEGRVGTRGRKEERRTQNK